MTSDPDPAQNFSDGVLASGLITAPAWGLWLNELNSVLTALSLLVGLAIGLHRIHSIVKHKTPGKDRR